MYPSGFTPGPPYTTILISPQRGKVCGSGLFTIFLNHFAQYCLPQIYVWNYLLRSAQSLVAPISSAAQCPSPTPWAGSVVCTAHSLMSPLSWFRGLVPPPPRLPPTLLIICPAAPTLLGGYGLSVNHAPLAQDMVIYGEGTPVSDEYCQILLFVPPPNYNS